MDSLTSLIGGNKKGITKNLAALAALMYLLFEVVVGMSGDVASLSKADQFYEGMHDEFRNGIEDLEDEVAILKVELADLRGSGRRGGN